MSDNKNMLIMDSILEAIGDTPLVKLNKVTMGLEANVLVKCEHLNPSGSVKDRMALRMVKDAEAEGLIKPGLSTITESSTGNTAQALAMVCAVRGYKLKVRYSEASWAQEKIYALDRYGTESEMFDMDDEEANRIAKNAGLHGATTEIPGRLKCLREEENTSNHLWIRQFSNSGNVAGQSEIGPELLTQTDGRIDVFIASIGTGGTFLGVTQVLKRELPNVKCVAVQPAGWEGWEDPLSPEKINVPGISGGIVQEIRDSGIADEIVYVGNEEAIEMAHRLSREEGIYCGTSSGANVLVALREAAKSNMKGKNVVTIIVDRGDRYLTSERYTT